MVRFAGNSRLLGGFRQVTGRRGVDLKSDGGFALGGIWNNQKTGIVNDEVFELKMEPANWGEITLAP
jgi:hypothetical protein